MSDDDRRVTGGVITLWGRRLADGGDRRYVVSGQPMGWAAPSAARPHGGGGWVDGPTAGPVFFRRLHPMGQNGVHVRVRGRPPRRQVASS